MSWVINEGRGLLDRAKRDAVALTKRRIWDGIYVAMSGALNVGSAIRALKAFFHQPLFSVWNEENSPMVKGGWDTDIYSATIDIGIHVIEVSLRLEQFTATRTLTVTMFCSLTDNEPVTYGVISTPITEES